MHFIEFIFQTVEYKLGRYINLVLDVFKSKDIPLGNSDISNQVCNDRVTQSEPMTRTAIILLTSTLII